MRKIISLTEITEAVPVQYEGYLDTGEHIYVRCRFGMGEVRVGTTEQRSNWTMPSIYTKAYEDSYKGTLSRKELEELLSKAELDFSEMKIIQRTEEQIQDMIDSLMKHLKEIPEREGEGTVFITTDKDILNNHTSSARLMQLQREIGNAEKLNPSKQ